MKHPVTTLMNLAILAGLFAGAVDTPREFYSWAMVLMWLNVMALQHLVDAKDSLIRHYKSLTEHQQGIMVALHRTLMNRK